MFEKINQLLQVSEGGYANKTNSNARVSCDFLVL